MLRWRFNNIRNALNLSTSYKFYSFKHTGASNLHMSGISMRELMDQLRHTKLDATQHYLKKHCGIVNNRIRDNFPDPLTELKYRYSKMSKNKKPRNFRIGVFHL